MNVAIGSAFRNASWYASRYLDQVVALQQACPEHEFRVIAAEGDSSDDTPNVLINRASTRHISLQLVACAHGGPWFGSTEAQARMIALSKVGNAIFDAVQTTDDVLVYVESDLLWNPLTISLLIDMAAQRCGGFDVFAPLVFAGSNFYDIWGFRKDGVRFGPFPPYHAGMNGPLTEIDSAGSCLVMRGDVARSCRIRNDECLVGWCADARARGYRIAACSDYKVNHP